MYSIGADPEFFIVSDKGVLPASLFTTGTKEKTETLVPGLEIHQDNITLEMNFEPQSTRQSWIDVIEYSMSELHKRIHPHKLVACPSLMFTQDDLMMFGPTALEFRCDPEENVWGDPRYKRPNKLLRSAGGHVHLGWSDPSRDEQTNVSLWLDLLIGLPCVLIEDHVPARARRANYGKPGSLRLKPYGLEYRTPGNEWLRGRTSIGMMYDLATHCLDYGLDGGINARQAPWTAQLVSRVQQCINKSNPREAKKILDELVI